MTFKDILKKSFLEGYANTEITPKHILIVMAITCVLALYIFFIYRFLTRKTFYNKSFNISLAVMAVLTAAIILTIQSSVVVSLGMVGALSIVRFRTAIKDPMDLAFLFWSISIGIICGAGMAEIAIITSLIATAGIWVLNALPVAKAPMLLVLNAQSCACEKEVLALVKEEAGYYKIKSRNLTRHSLDMILEVRVKEETDLLQKLQELDGVSSVSLLSHDGEVTF